MALCAAPCLAVEQVIPVPGEGWHLRFEAPALEPLKSNVPSVFYGHAGRLQVSMFAEAPRCPGPDTNENIYNCFAAALKRSPYVVWETERGNTVPNGVQVMYLSRMEVEGKVGSSFNLNLLFARRGKWVDFHVSMAAPAREDVDALLDLMKSVKIEDDVVAPAGAATAATAASAADRDPPR
jgi:hypothetical protein